MKLFTNNQAVEARHHAMAGGQALLLYQGDMTSPKKKRARLFDQNESRLIKTAKQLGQNRMIIWQPGSPSQHINVCGMALRRALALCKREGASY